MNNVRTYLTQHPLIVPLVVAVAGLLYGLAVHGLTVLVRDHGPTVASLSFRGNGAIIVPVVLGLLGLLIGEWFCVRLRSWLSVAILPVAFIVGLVVVAGGF